MIANKQHKLQTLPFKRPDSEKLLFEIVDLSNLNRPIPTNYHRHDFYELILIFEGSTKHKVDFLDYEVQPKEILIIPQNSVHKGNFYEKPKGFIILFTADFFSKEQFQYVAILEVFNASLNSNKIKFNDDNWQEILQLFQSLNSEYLKHKSMPNYNMHRFLILAFVTKLNHLFKETNKPFLASSDICRPFFELLEKNYAQEHSVNFYCNQLNCTPKKLSQILLNSAGKSTLNFVLDRVFLEAKRELMFSNKSVKEIAFSLGFEDQLYFSKTFKKSIGCSPQDFKKQYA